MESLQNYGTDDSSSSDTEEKLTEEKYRTDELNSNFFHLESPSHKVSLGVRKEKLDPVCPQGKKSENNEKGLEIPNSEFWSGFCPNESTTEEDIDNLSMETFTHQDSCIPSSSRTLTSKRKISSVLTDSCHFDKRVCNDRGINNARENAKEERRKIFFVHSKVMPYLSMNSVSKCSSSLDSSLSCHDSTVNRLSWNVPNYSHLVATAGMDSLIKIWNVWSQLDKCVSTITSHHKAVRMVSWGHSGRTILSGSYDKTAVITDVETDNVLCRFDHQGFVTACAKHPFNSHCFVTGCEDVIQMWDQRRPGGPVKTFHVKDKLGQVQDLLFIQDGQELLSCTDVVARDSADKTIMAWDVRSGVVLSNQIFQERYTCTRLKLHPSSGQFLAQTQGGYVAAFSTNRPYKMDKSKRYEGHQMQGYNIGFDLSLDGKFLYSGSAEGGMHCYDHHTGRLVRKCSMLKNSVVMDVACHPVLPSVVASCTWGGHLSLWR